MRRCRSLPLPAVGARTRGAVPSSPSRPSSRRCHQCVSTRPATSAITADGHAAPGEVTGEGDDGDVDREQLPGGDDHNPAGAVASIGLSSATAVPSPLRPVVGGGNVPPDHACRTRRACNRAIVVDAAAAAVTIAAVSPSPSASTVCRGSGRDPSRRRADRRPLLS